MDWTHRKRSLRRDAEERARAFKRYVHPTNHAEHRRYVAYIGEIEIYRAQDHRLARTRATMHAISLGYGADDVRIEVAQHHGH